MIHDAGSKIKSEKHEIQSTKLETIANDQYSILGFTWFRLIDYIATKL